MAFVIGSPVEGNDFKNRKNEVVRLVNFVLKQHKRKKVTHMALYAQRRMGKSSLLLRVEEELTAQGIRVIHLDMLPENEKTYYDKLKDEFVNKSGWREKLVRTMKKGTKAVSKAAPQYELPDKMGKVGLSWNPDTPWQEDSKQFYRWLAALSEDQKYAVLIDEIGFVRKNMSEETAKLFLRDIRTHLTKIKIPFIFCSSYNIYLIFDDLWRNNLQMEKLLQFTETTAKEELLKPNFEEDGALQLTPANMEKLCRFIFRISNGHPQMMNLLGDRFLMNFQDVKYNDLPEYGKIQAAMNVAVDDCIFNDSQHFIKELMNEDSLGGRHNDIKQFLVTLIENHIESRADAKLHFSNVTDFNEMLGLLKEYYYLREFRGKIRFVQPFLKYYLGCHIGMADEIKKEISRLWNS